MAERAHQEPSMEEILSSIRKIIADDSAETVSTPSEKKADVIDVSEADDASFDDLELTVEESPELVELTEKLTADMFDAGIETAEETVADVLAAETFEDAVAAPEFFAGAAEAAQTDDDVFETQLDTAATGDSFIDDTFETVAEPEETMLDGFSSDVIEAPLAEDKQPEEVMAEAEAELAPPKAIAPSEALTDSRTVDAAAGSLGKLMSKVEFGDEGGASNTIEGVVKDLLRPMLKAWLDDNLPAIVDKHVEAEVQRIARMAR